MTVNLHLVQTHLTFLNKLPRVSSGTSLTLKSSNQSVITMSFVKEAVTEMGSLTTYGMC